MLLFTEGFDWSTAIADYVTYGKWFDRATMSIGNTSGTLRFGSGSGNYLAYGTRSNFLRMAIGQNLASGVFGFALRADTAVNYKANLLVLFDTTANVQMGILLNTDGTMSLFRTDHSTILATSAAAIVGNQWHFIELKFKISDSITSGDVVLYMDGVAIITLATTTDTKNTANAYCTHICFGGNTPTLTSGGSSNLYHDDVYLLDLTGSSPTNAVLGNVRIQTIIPTVSGNSSDFTGSDGNSVNNYQQIDDATTSLSDYNDGTALNQKDTYGCGDTVAATSTIYAVAVNHISIRTDTGLRSVAPVVRHSSTDYVGSNQALGSSPLNYQQIMETNPGTSSGWTKSDVDAAEFGLKVTV